MRILGVDPGVKRCGMCVLNSDTSIRKSLTVEGGGLEYGEMLHNIMTAAIDLIKLEGVGAVAVEKPMFFLKGGFSASLRPLYMIEGAVNIAAYESMVHCHTYQVTEWRKIVFGKPTGVKNWKKRAIELAMEYTGVKLPEDEAEAYCIALACKMEYARAMANEEKGND